MKGVTTNPSVRYSTGKRSEPRHVRQSRGLRPSLKTIMIVYLALGAMWPLSTGVLIGLSAIPGMSVLAYVFAPASFLAYFLYWYTVPYFGWAIAIDFFRRFPHEWRVTLPAILLFLSSLAMLVTNTIYLRYSIDLDAAMWVVNSMFSLAAVIVPIEWFIRARHKS